MILKLGMDYQVLKDYKVHINGDPGLTLTYFSAKVKFGQICSLCFRPIVRSALVVPLVLWFTICKLGDTFVRRCFRDADIHGLLR